MTRNSAPRDIKKIRLAFTAEQSRDQAEAARVRNDPDLNDEGKRKLLEPINARMQARFDQAQKQIGPLLDRAKADYLSAGPRAQQRAAALQKMDNANKARSLVAGASSGERRALLALIVSTGDLAGVYGARQAISAISDLPEKEMSELQALLDTVKTPESDEALAVYVASRVEHANLESTGWKGATLADGVMASPSAALTRSRSAVNVETEDGGLRTFSESEVAGLLASAGVAQ